MPRERKKSPRLRLFFALDLPRESIEAIAVWQDSLGGSGDIRLMPRSNLHVTLVFLGYQYEKNVEKIHEVAKAALEGKQSMTLSFHEAVIKPRKNPRILTLSVDDDDGDLAALNGQLGRSLSEEGLYREEARRFWPHVTVARFRRPRRGREGPPRGSFTVPDLPERLSQPFRAVRISLYSSKLGPKGSVYEAIAHIELAR